MKKNIFNFINANFILEKFRPSSLKGVENLKFIPINLHLENLILEQINVKQQQLLIDLSDGNEQSTHEMSCYPFTSVGAFTTFHTNKPTYKKSLEELMISDKGFKFDKADNVIKNIYV